jgi:hypothetical protein
LNIRSSPAHIRVEQPASLHLREHRPAAAALMFPGEMVIARGAGSKYESSSQYRVAVR